MLSEEEAMVGTQNDRAVVHLVARRQRPEDSTYVFIVGFDPGVVILDDFLQASRTVGEYRGSDDLVIGIRNRPGFARVTGKVVVEIVRLGNSDAIVQVGQAPRTVERLVRCIEPDE